MMGCGQSMEDLGGRKNPAMAGRDNEWFEMITIANETEIQTSRMALAQSQNESVKTFAQEMIDAHLAAEQKVSSLAADCNVALPTKLDDRHQKMVDNLKGETGPDFDRAYVKLQVDAHGETLDADQDEANLGSNPRVKALAGDLLGTLQHHLTMAQTLENQMM
jgi:putative membrane protein